MHVSVQSAIRLEWTCWPGAWSGIHKLRRVGAGPAGRCRTTGRCATARTFRGRTQDGDASGACQSGKRPHDLAVRQTRGTPAAARRKSRGASSKATRNPSRLNTQISESTTTPLYWARFEVKMECPALVCDAGPTDGKPHAAAPPNTQIFTRSTRNVVASAGAVKNDLKTQTAGDMERQLESLKTELDITRNRVEHLYELWTRERMTRDTRGKNTKPKVTPADMEWIRDTLRSLMTKEEAIQSMRHDRGTR